MTNHRSVTRHMLLDHSERPPLLQPSRRIRVEFSYSTADPYAVHMLFHGDTAQAHWVVGRELLIDGLTTCSGSAVSDVWARPFPLYRPDGGAPGLVIIELSSPDGRATFSASLARLGDFLARTCEIVPLGQESQHIDVDAGLREMLDGVDSD